MSTPAPSSSLMDEDGSLPFVEMNARIQVEHPVTEMVTGIDLVKSQILLATGAKMSDIIPKFDRTGQRGHAIECRINAEHPEKIYALHGQDQNVPYSWRPGRARGYRCVRRGRDSALLRFSYRQTCSLALAKTARRPSSAHAARLGNVYCGRNS